MKCAASRQGVGGFLKQTRRAAGRGDTLPMIAVSGRHYCHVHVERAVWGPQDQGHRKQLGRTDLLQEE